MQYIELTTTDNGMRYRLANDYCPTDCSGWSWLEEAEGDEDIDLCHCADERCAENSWAYPLPVCEVAADGDVVRWPRSPDGQGGAQPFGAMTAQRMR